MTVLSNGPAPDLLRLMTYTVIGLVDEDADQPELLIAAIIEGEAATGEVTEHCGPDDRYARFCRQVPAASAEDAARQCHEQVAEEYECHAYPDWAATDQKLYQDFIFQFLSPNARAILAVLAQRPGRQYTGEQLAAITGMRNSKVVAGTFAHPGMLNFEVERTSFWSTGRAANGRCVYWLTDAQARLFRRSEEQDR
ncbi:DUF6416 domain-containing protein [Actinoplanes sp. NPDC049802]|uniref:DUF6416 domain-containing protein n=1 Tax=Actinoplanes sp. NPDC049802 TaxID=3154742 RepID=UPI0033D285A7